MQLDKSSRVFETVVLLATNLLNASLTMAADVSNAQVYQTDDTINFYDEPAPTEQELTVDVAMVNYEEKGRVKAVEPMVAVKYVNDRGTVFTAKYTYDTLTGATPNGAAPSARTQKFIVSSVPSTSTVTRTSSSGRSITTTVNGNQVVAYEAQPGDLPLAYGFQDQRHSVDLGMTTDVLDNTRVSIGATISRESDYATNGVRTSVIQTFNNELTTVSMGVSFEANTSKPDSGIPAAFSRMNGSPGAVDQLKKDVSSFNAGVTQVMTRDWLLSANYNYGRVSGYQSDPYRVISLLHTWEGYPWTGYAMDYLFENRPEQRTRHSVYVGNKLAFDSYVLDVSGRLYNDDWGIDSQTLEASLHVPLWQNVYVEPSIRFYHQSAADFFRYYLPASEDLPRFASADSRLDSFDAITLGLRTGISLNKHLEAYAMAEYYTQQKSGAKGVLPGISEAYDPFAGTDAAVGMVGMKYTF